jgi:hypothetical protein
MKHISIIFVFVVLFALALTFTASFAQDQWRTPAISAQPLASFNHIPKKPGHYSADDWAAIIDSTWGTGLSTSTKLQLFDAAWNKLNAEYAAFQNLNVDWQALGNLYRPEVADTSNPVSRGRFAAIMNHLGLALQEAHTFIDDKLVNQNTPLAPGVPLFVVGAWADNSHFGASLTPLPDSSLLVFKTLPNHPLGLVLGDIVLGYDGLPWKVLYKEILAAQLPIYKPYFWGSSESAMTHNMLMSAGMNWHLFDTLDVVKYNNGDTLHFSTASLAGQTGFIWGNEQLNIPGVPWPNINGNNVFSWRDIANLGDYVSWGVIPGTQIGYIYVLAWASNNIFPGSNISTEFYNAVDSLMNYYETTGLIIDQRLNYGAWWEYKQGLSSLFNFTVETFGLDTRCGDPNNHFQMCPHPTYTCSFNAIRGNPMTFYDKPIAVLTGPGAVSAGDEFPLSMTFHPMVKVFGKSTAGAFSGGEWGDLMGNSGWEIVSTFANAYLCSDPGIYLAHTESEIDEEVWLTQEDVANGEDTVVKAAKAWINSMIHAYNVKPHSSFIRPAIDTLTITANVANPNTHNISVAAIINTLDNVFVDSIPMFDDGNHGDSLAGDGIYGCFLNPLTAEDVFSISASVTDLDSSHYHILLNASLFTTIGQVVVDSVDRHFPDPAVGFRLKLYLRNKGLVATANNVTAEVSTNDSNVTNIANSIGLFGDIAPGQINTSTSDYIVFTQNNPDIIDFIVHIFSNDWFFWSDSFRVVITGLAENETMIPLDYALKQNYPNPFNPTTNIEFSIPKAQFVTLKVYNILGEEVVTLVSERLAAGSYKYDWDAGTLASGVYLYRIKAGAFMQTKKLLLLR